MEIFFISKEIYQIIFLPSNIQVFKQETSCKWINYSQVHQISYRRMNINHLCQYHQYSIIGSCFIVETNYVFLYQIAYLTLNFDLVTLNLGQVQNPINTYHVYIHHQCAIIGWWYIAQTRFFFKWHIWPWPLTLWPCDLEST